MREGRLGSAVSTLLRDHDGNLWIATFGAGLVRWRDSQFVSAGRLEGLQGDSPWSIAEGPPGHETIAVRAVAVRALLQDAQGRYGIGITEGLDMIEHVVVPDVTARERVFPPTGFSPSMKMRVDPSGLARVSVDGVSLALTDAAAHLETAREGNLTDLALLERNLRSETAKVMDSLRARRAKSRARRITSVRIASCTPAQAFRGYHGQKPACAVIQQPQTRGIQILCVAQSIRQAVDALGAGQRQHHGPGKEVIGPIEFLFGASGQRAL